MLPSGAIGRHGAPVLVAAAGRAELLPCAVRAAAAGDLLRGAPGQAAVVAVRLTDRRVPRDELVRVRLVRRLLEGGPGDVRATVERRGRVVVGDDPLLVVEDGAALAVGRCQVAVVDHDRLVPAEATVGRARHDDVREEVTGSEPVASGWADMFALR